MGVRWNDQAAPAVMSRLTQTVAALKPHTASVGIHEREGSSLKVDYNGSEGADTLAEVMIRHEYGAGDNIPERSFLRRYFDERKGALARGMFEAARAELQGDKDAIRRWVSGVFTDWRAWIDSTPFKPLSGYTVERKAKAGLGRPQDPLIATEQFLRSWAAELDGTRL